MFFYSVLPVCVVFVSAGLGGAMRMYRHLLPFEHIQEV
jgi:hypothetical protein